ncbi:MAG: GNAT family N-acetyltransferase [Acetobacteraceae bacterium]
MPEQELSIVVRNTDSDVARLWPQWRELYNRVGRSPFQNPRWHRLWWEHIGSAGNWRPYTVAAYRGDDLVAVVPLAVNWTRGIRQLEWAGISFFDYPDLLAEHHVDVEFLWHAITCLGGFDVARLRDVRADGQSFPALKLLSREAARSSPVYAIELEHGSGQAWYETLSKRSRANHAASLRRLERIGTTSLRQVTDVSAVPGAIRLLVEQKREWAEKRGLENELSERSQRFLECLALQALSDGNLHLSMLQSGNETIAMHFGFVSQDGFYYYLPSYHPGFAAMSPGRVHLVEMVKWAGDNGYRRFDFLRGEDQYKSLWGREARELHDFTLPRGWVGRIATGVHGLRQRVGLASLLTSVA